MMNYFAIEGIDTCGKSTQILKLKEIYTNAVFTKEPGGSQIGSVIRKIVLEDDSLDERARFLLFLADRAQHIKEVISKNEGKLIFSDRSVVSGISYARKNIENDEFLIQSNIFATNGFLPSHIFVLFLSKEELEKRLSLKTIDAIEKQGIDYLLKVQDDMVWAIEKLNLKYSVIDASLKIDEITKQIQRVVDAST